MWFILAITAAMLWGASYAISGRLLLSISVPSLLFFTSAVSTVVMLAFALLSQRFTSDVHALLDSKNLLLLLGAAIATYILANAAISYSIAGRNATLAAAIEIAYPFFTAFAAWIFFAEKQFNTATLFGGLLIFTGATIISVYAM